MVEFTIVENRHGTRFVECSFAAADDAAFGRDDEADVTPEDVVREVGPAAVWSEGSMWR